MSKILRKKSTILLISMVFLDVIVKVIVDIFFREFKFLLNNKIGFVPFLNTEQLSILNNELELDVKLNYLILINLIGVVAIVFVRKRLKKEKEWNIILDTATLMISAGVVCSLIDKIFWKGSLDYILFFSKILDLKDIYLFVGLFIYIADVCRQLIKGLLQKLGKV